MIISHFLIGPPSSGKSTFASQFIELIPTVRIVSSDAIRTLLFGDESIQGDWSLIEEKILSQIQEALQAGQPVIYDATNAKPEWRKSLLNRVRDDHVQWMAWHLQTPLSLCKAWNKQRLRQVPDIVIEEFFQSLQQFPPSEKDGFVIVNSVSITEQGFDLAQIERQLKDLKNLACKSEG